MRRSNRIKAPLPRLTEFHVGTKVRDEDLDHAPRGEIIEVLYDACLVEWENGNVENVDSGTVGDMIQFEKNFINRYNRNEEARAEELLAAALLDEDEAVSIPVVAPRDNATTADDVEQSLAQLIVVEAPNAAEALSISAVAHQDKTAPDDEEERLVLAAASVATPTLSTRVVARHDDKKAFEDEENIVDPLLFFSTAPVSTPEFATPVVAHQDDEKAFDAVEERDAPLLNAAAAPVATPASSTPLVACQDNEIAVENQAVIVAAPFATPASSTPLVPRQDDEIAVEDQAVIVAAPFATPASSTPIFACQDDKIAAEDDEEREAPVAIPEFATPLFAHIREETGNIEGPYRDNYHGETSVDETPLNDSYDTPNRSRYLNIFEGISPFTRNFGNLYIDEYCECGLSKPCLICPTKWRF